MICIGVKHDKYQVFTRKAGKPLFMRLQAFKKKGRRLGKSTFSQILII